MECVSACFGAVVGIALLFQQIIAHVHLSILKFVSSRRTGCCCNKYIKSCNYYSKDSNSYRLTGYKISYRLVVNYNLSIYNDEIIRIKSKGKIKITEEVKIILRDVPSFIKVNKVTTCDPIYIYITGLFARVQQTLISIEHKNGHSYASVQTAVCCYRDPCHSSQTVGYVCTRLFFPPRAGNGADRSQRYNTDEIS